jgi:3-hydroxybutyryl-CoA dehydrogenase
LQDISEEALERSKRAMTHDYRTYLMLRSDLTISLEEIVRNIHFTLSVEPLSDVDLVIENVPEKLELKKKVYSELDQICSSHALFAANTSCIPISEIASLTMRPENVIGVHFMNPVPLKSLVELICGDRTSQSTLFRTKGFLRDIKKFPVEVKDSPGFAANRVSHLFMNEAAFLVHETIATPAQVDAIFKKGYGHAMGPLETADLIGIDSVVHSLDILFERLRDSKFSCCPLLRKLLTAGSLGRKSGRGFYVYD